VLSHLLVLALVGAMIWAGVWQLNRLNERQDQNARIELRSAVLSADIADLVPADAAMTIGEELQYSRVEATGTFDRGAEVLVRNRPLEGGPGRWILSPLVLDDGRAVIVNRGWIPNSLGPEQPRPDADPPAGRVTVAGFVRPTETATGLQVDDPEDGVLTTVARPNIARLDQQTPYKLLPLFIQMESVEPPGGALPLPLELPPLDNGPHLSYAAQWFIFTTIALVGYPLILRRVAQGRARSLEEATEAEVDLAAPQRETVEA